MTPFEMFGMDPSNSPLLNTLASLSDVNAIRAAIPAPSMPAMRPGMGQYIDRSINNRAVREGMQGPPRPAGVGRGFGVGGMGGGQMPSILPNPAMSGGMTAFNDPSTANQMLGQYGLALPQHINPYLMLNDQNADGSPSFFGRHQRLGHMLEGGLLGAQVPQGATTGENIANIARTVMGIPAAYAEHANAQMMQPFQAASQMAQLQGLQDKHQQSLNVLLDDESRRNLEAAQTDYYNDRGMRLHQPVPAEGGAWIEDQDHQWKFQEGPGGKQPHLATTGGFTGQMIEGQLGKPPAQGDNSPAAVKYWQDAQKLFTQIQGQVAGAHAAGTFAGTPGKVADDSRMTYEAKKGELQKQLSTSLSKFIGQNPDSQDPYGDYQRMIQDTQQQLNNLQPYAPRPSQPTPRGKKSNPMNIAPSNPFRKK